MRTRNIPIQVWLNNEEFRHLDKLSHKSGLSFSNVLRSLIMGEHIKERVHPDYRMLLRAVDHIGNNINQIAHNTNVADEASCEDIANVLLLMKEIKSEIQSWKVQWQ